jgi:hypothetical protein
MDREGKWKHDHYDLPRPTKISQASLCTNTLSFIKLFASRTRRSYPGRVFNLFYYHICENKMR